MVGYADKKADSLKQLPAQEVPHRRASSSSTALTRHAFRAVEAGPQERGWHTPDASRLHGPGAGVFGADSGLPSLRWYHRL